MPISNAVLKNALVAPRHQLKEGVGYLEHVPGLFIDPFYSPPAAKKKKGKKKKWNFDMEKQKFKKLQFVN